MRSFICCSFFLVCLLCWVFVTHAFSSFWSRGENFLVGVSHFIHSGPVWMPPGPVRMLPGPVRMLPCSRDDPDIPTHS